MKKLKDILVCLLILALALAVSYFFGRRDGWRAAEEGMHSEIIRDTVVRYDTIVRLKPVPVVERVVDSIMVPVPVTEHDTVLISLPRTEREYRDSTYFALVSGFSPSLDRIEVYPKTVTISEIETRWKEAPRWSFGVSAGLTVCYGFRGLNAGAGATAGVTYRF